MPISPQYTAYKSGERVRHPSLGDGTVAAFSSEWCYTVYVTIDGDPLGFSRALDKRFLTKPTPTYTSYRMGDRVLHPTRGKGTVYQNSGSAFSWANVKFDNSAYYRGAISISKSDLSEIPHVELGDLIEVTGLYHPWSGMTARVTGRWHDGVSAVIGINSRDIKFADFRLIEAGTTTTTNQNTKDNDMTQNLPAVGDKVTFKSGFKRAGETATVISVNPNARKYPVQVEYEPETQHRSLNSIVEPPRKFDFKVGDRVEAALGDSIIRGAVTYAAESFIEVKLDGTRSSTTIRAKSDFEVTKLIDLPTAQYAQILVGATVLTKIGDNFVNVVTGLKRSPARVTKQVVNEGREYKVLYAGLNA